MQGAFSLTLLGVAIAVQLLATGCDGLGGGGGSSTSRLFDSGSGSSGSGSDSGSSTFASLSTGLGDSGGPMSNPEPASVALFGGGLLGFGIWLRRKASKRS